MLKMTMIVYSNVRIEMSWSNPFESVIRRGSRKIYRFLESMVK